MIRTMFWGAAWLVSGIAFFGLSIYAMIGLIIPVMTISTWKSEEAGLIAILVIFGVVILKLLLALGAYKLVTYCWSRLQQRKVGRIVLATGCGRYPLAMSNLYSTRLRSTKCANFSITTSLPIISGGAFRAPGDCHEPDRPSVTQVR
jgi:hypothetical protein